MALGLMAQPVMAGGSQTDRATEFAAADTDSSGGLTLAEMQTYFSAKIETRFTELDTDSDSALSLEEFTVNETDRSLAFATELFNLADADNSTSLDLDEFTDIAPNNSNGEIIRYFAMLDQDSDLSVSEAEYTGSRKSGMGPFGKMSKNSGRRGFGRH